MSYYLNNGPFESRGYPAIVKYFLDFVERYWLYSGFYSTLSCGGPYIKNWLRDRSNREIAEVAASVFFDRSLGDGFGGTTGYSIVGLTDEGVEDIFFDFVKRADGTDRTVEEKIDILLYDELVEEYVAEYVRLEEEKLALIIEAFNSKMEWSADWFDGIDPAVDPTELRIDFE